LPSHTLVDAELRTGRTHQIRVHLASLGHPIVGDTKYGDDDLQNLWWATGVKRMYLHAWQLRFEHPITDKPLTLSTAMPESFEQIMGQLSGQATQREDTTR
jgi:23S rRNA pseudouridine955/2504/2580 synthase